jgi:predicted RNA methylase
MPNETAHTFRQPGNEELFQAAIKFIDVVDEIKAQHPLTAPYRYYPYNTALGIPSYIRLSDKHGVDFMSHIVGKTVVDMACADGDLTFLMEHVGAERVIAMDYAPYNENGLRGFKSVAKVIDSRVQLVDADVHHLNFSHLPKVDTIFCFGFLYHSPNPMLVLEKFARTAEHLFMTTKIFDNEKSYGYFYAPGECNGDSTNWWAHTPEALRRTIERAGFNVQFMERLDSHIGNSDPVDMARDGRVLLYATRNHAIQEQSTPEQQAAWASGVQYWTAATDGEQASDGAAPTVRSSPLPPVGSLGIAPRTTLRTAELDELRRQAEDGAQQRELVASRDRTIEQLQQELQSTRRELSALRRSRVWRTATTYWWLKKKLGRPWRPQSVRW